MSFPKLCPAGDQRLGLRHAQPGQMEPRPIPCQAQGARMSQEMGPCANQPVSQEPTDHRNEPHPPPTGLGAPPASTAPGLVAWSTAKVGPWAARGVLRSSQRPGEWKPAEASAQEPLSQPGDVHPSFKASTAWEQGQRNGGEGVLASKKAAPLQPATSSRPLKSLPFKGSKGPLHLPLESHLCQEAGQEQSTPRG